MEFIRSLDRKTESQNAVEAIADAKKILADRKAGQTNEPEIGYPMATPVFIDRPSPAAGLKVWEEHLKMLQTHPNSSPVLALSIESAKRTIAKIKAGDLPNGQQKE